MIYTFLADGTEELEAIAPIDILRRGGFQVKVVGVTGRTVLTSHKISIICDSYIEDEELPGEKIEAILLPGGMPGVTNLENSPKLHAFLDAAVKDSAFLCAICAAPSILGHKFLLKGKKAIAFPGFEDDLYGADVQKGSFVVRDGKVITARGAGVSVQYGLTILEALTNHETAEKIAKAIQFS